jgi:hypothetical protein
MEKTCFVSNGVESIEVSRDSAFEIMRKFNKEYKPKYPYFVISPAGEALAENPQSRYVYTIGTAYCVDKDKDLWVTVVNTGSNSTTVVVQDSGGNMREESGAYVAHQSLYYLDYNDGNFNYELFG